MSNLYWLAQLPSTDDAFIPLHRLELLADEADYPLLELAHRQAVRDASWGHPLVALEERAAKLLADAEAQADRAHWPEDQAAVHRSELEAQGYALGVTAVRVALRAHCQDDMAAAS